MSLPSRNDERWSGFAAAVRKSESSGNYAAVNRYGYLGAYQFGMARLCDLGLTTRKMGTSSRDYSNDAFEWDGGWSRERFLSDHAKQDELFREHCKRWASWIARKGYDKRHPDVSLSAMLGICHLLGGGGLAAYFIEEDRADANGTKASDYAGRFGEYF